MKDPFAVLGLPARPDLTGDEIRAAWRRMAAATHPDRADGGDPARYAEAAAAYTTLRTASGRGEAYADLAGAPTVACAAAPTAACAAAPTAACAAAPTVACAAAARPSWRCARPRPPR